MFDLGFGNSECGLKSPARAGLFFCLEGVMSFCLDAKGPKNQGFEVLVIYAKTLAMAVFLYSKRSFGLNQKNQKFKAV